MSDLVGCPSYDVCSLCHADFVGPLVISGAMLYHCVMHHRVFHLLFVLLLSTLWYNSKIFVSIFIPISIAALFSSGSRPVEMWWLS